MGNKQFLFDLLYFQSNMILNNTLDNVCELFSFYKELNVTLNYKRRRKLLSYIQQSLLIEKWAF
jgi:hypothetical protein